MRRTITLTTDFGLQDAYVASMKAVIWSVSPECRIVDVTHLVPPQDIASCAYVLTSMFEYFVRDSIHVAVVDPGVGTDRRPIAIETSSGVFVGPDNGTFTGVLDRQGVVDLSSGRLVNTLAVELDRREFWRSEISSTFHGRDIFASVAGHLAQGVGIDRVGSPIDRVSVLNGWQARVDDGTIYGAIVHVDRFGNAISNIAAEAIPSPPIVEIAGCRLVGLSENFQSSELMAIVGSSGFVEIAARNGSAAKLLGIETGTRVTVREAL